MTLAVKIREKKRVQEKNGFGFSISLLLKIEAGREPRRRTAATDIPRSSRAPASPFETGTLRSICKTNCVFADTPGLLSLPPSGALLPRLHRWAPALRPQGPASSSHDLSGCEEKRLFPAPQTLRLAGCTGPLMWFVISQDEVSLRRAGKIYHYQALKPGIDQKSRCRREHPCGC